MADASPFDYDPPAAQHEQEAKDGDVEEDEEEDEEEEDADDPFANVDNPTSSSTGPAFGDFSAPGKELPPVEEEETAQSIWEKERSQILAERKKKAEEDKASLQAAAKEDLSKFYADSSSKLEKNKKVNRADEKMFRTDTAEIFKSGSKWEKVNRLVNLQPKAGEKPGQSRVDRYRKLLLQLKTEKPKAKALTS